MMSTCCPGESCGTCEASGACVASAACAQDNHQSHAADALHASNTRTTKQTIQGLAEHFAKSC